MSPHISLPTYLILIGFGSGGTTAYRSAVSETPASFRACVCGLRHACARTSFQVGAAASQGERGTFRSGLLHWLTTMECPGLVLPRLFLLLSPHWLTTMGHTHVFPLLGEFDLSHPFATAGLLSVLDDGYGILTAEYRLWRDQCGGAASPRLRALLRGE